jgi:broad specificity phosphatase PhoE
MATIFLLRHGETAWNIEKVFRGQAEVPLTENGRRQAQCVAIYLEEKGIETIYSSPLSRALETARIVGETIGLLPEIDKRITGLNFGKWQGRPYSEIEGEYPRDFLNYKTAPHRFRSPGGETLDQAQKRCMELLEEVGQKHPDGTALIVTHRVICKLMVLGIFGLDSLHFWQLKPDTCSLSELQINPKGFVLERFNDTHFLSDTERITADF